MRKGYKYYPAENMPGFGVILQEPPADASEFSKDYETLDLKTSSDFKSYFSSEWIDELHKIYEKYLRKDVVTVGVGSGVGEHELLLSEKGYDVIASDILPELSRKTAGLFPGFRFMTLDIFKDDVLRTLENDCGLKAPEFDILVCGLDFYFDDAKASELFECLAHNVKKGSYLIFTLRYRDYFLAPAVEAYQYFEAFLLSALKRKKVICKKHGYRRTAGEIIKMADAAGFFCERKHIAMYACEWHRSKLGSKILRYIFKFTDKYIYPLFYSGIVFKFRKL